MDVSVVIVSYNVSSFLHQALTTLADAAASLEVETFVVDNASTDGSADMVKERHPWVTLIENRENLGFARANNIALKRACGRYVLLLNPDTVLRRDTLRIMVRFLDEHPQAGAAGCRVINPDGTLQLACRRGFPTPGVAFFKMAGLSGLFPKSHTFGAYNLTYLDPDRTAEVDAVSGSFIMIRKSVLDRVGLLDETFFMYGEDLDLCYRIRETGAKIYYVPDTEIIHFKGESTRTVSSVRSVTDFYRAMHLFVNKHYRNHSIRYIPQWLLIGAIYIRMGMVHGWRLLQRAAQPLLDLALLNLSLMIGIMLRFGSNLSLAPNYTRLEWVTVFLVYSLLYMTTFFLLGLYHRYRDEPSRAVIGVFIGFLFHVFIINFVREYNFSRIASFYCWGFNTIFISGWRFLLQLFAGATARDGGKNTVIVAGITEAAALKQRLESAGMSEYAVIGCVEVSPDAIRGGERDGLHVLGLVDDLGDVIREYGVEVVIMTGGDVPYSRILQLGGRFSGLRPQFKLVPEQKNDILVKEGAPNAPIIIDIHPGSSIENARS